MYEKILSSIIVLPFHFEIIDLNWYRLKNSIIIYFKFGIVLFLLFFVLILWVVQKINFIISRYLYFFVNKFKLYPIDRLSPYIIVYL